MAAGEDSLEESVRSLIADVSEEASLPTFRKAKGLEALSSGFRRLDGETKFFLSVYRFSPASFSKDWSSPFSIS
jgi:hypothetical protein